MEKALVLATYAIGVCRPNPAVGAIVVKDGAVIGEGFTQKPGSAHAEVVALQKAGGAAAGADLFVSLEPCCHFGRTPPCTDSIIAAKIRRVYYGALDCNELVAGKGLAKLRAAGIEVFEEGLSGRVAAFYESYRFFVKNGTPFVSVKIAESMDGFIAGVNKCRVQISGGEAQRRFHTLRSQCDAVLIGGGTLICDSPKLNVRGVEGANPLRVVFNGKRSLPEDSPMFNAGNPVTVYSISSQNIAGAVVKILPSENFADNWNFILSDFAKNGMHHILVEAGATLAKNLFAVKNSFQEFLLCTAPLRLKEGFEWRSALASDSPQTLSLRKTETLGKDLISEFAVF